MLSDLNSVINASVIPKLFSIPGTPAEEQHAQEVYLKAFKQLEPLVISQKLDTSWRLDPRVQPALLHIGQLYGNKTKYYGKMLLATHPIWNADKAFTQWTQDLELQKKTGQDPVIAAFVKDPVLAAFIQLLHDYVEENREAAQKAKQPFNEELAYAVLISLWPRAEDRPKIRENVQWMTDQEGLHKKPRIDAQIAKALDENQSCWVGADKQIARFDDKLEQILGDVRERRAFLRAQARAEAEGRTLPSDIHQLRRFGMPDADVVKSLAKAEIKSYVLHFPDVPKADKKRYRQALRYLKAELVRIQGLEPQPEPRGGTQKQVSQQAVAAPAPEVPGCALA